MKTFASLTLVWWLIVILSTLTAEGADKIAVAKVTANNEAPGYEVKTGPTFGMDDRNPGRSGEPQSELEWQYASLLNDLPPATVSLLCPIKPSELKP